MTNPESRITIHESRITIPALSPKILVIQTAFIGDVVLATGALESLHAALPEATLDFLVRRGNEGLLENHPFLRHVLVWNKKEGKYRNLMRLLRRIRAEKYDYVINLQRFTASGVLTVFSGARHRIGFAKNPLSRLFSQRFPHELGQKGQKEYRHELERNHALIAALAGPLVSRPRLYPSEADYRRVEEFKTQPYITIAPTSVWFTKQYPADKWAEFIKAVPRGFKIYLTGGPGDTGHCHAIVKAAGRANAEVLAGKLSFLQSAALMQDAVMNYTNDSAPLHFAGSVNAPVAAVFCSTIPEFGFGPVSDVSHIVEIQEDLYCRPCGLHGRRECPEGHFRCAYSIKAEQLTRLLPEL